MMNHTGSYAVGIFLKERMLSMKQKRLLSGLLTVALAIGLCAPASLAADKTLGTSSTETNKMETTITINSTLQLPLIEVTIAAPGGLVVNPYGIACTTPITSSDTLISAPALITNNSDIGMVVSATPTVTLGDVVVAESADEITNDTEKATLYMQLVMGTLTGTPTDATGFDPDDVTTATQKAVVKKSGSDSAKLTLNAATGTDPSRTKTYGAYEIIGKSGGNNWPNDDITVNVVFNITPASRASST